MRIKDAEFVIVDLETTGMHANQDQILEIGAVRVKGNKVEDTFERLVDPGCEVSWRITQITGITTADVCGQPQVAEVLPDFVEFVGNAIFVAHNVAFDWKFIASELSRAGLPALKNQTLCTVRLARRLLKGLPSRSLESLIKHFDINPGDRHRALSDACATQEVLTQLLLMLERQHEITELDELLHFQNIPYAKNPADQQRLEHIRKNYLKKLPHSPGVYQMLRKDGKLLYIGKARVLSERVRSHFTGTEGHAQHIRAMIRQVHDIEWTQTETELEALLLESRLIKEHIPPFNKAGRKHRSRTFLRLGEISNSSWVILTKHVRADGARHYGPMATHKEATHLAQVLVSLYGASPNAFRSSEQDGIGLESSRIGGPLTEEGFVCAIAFLEGRDTQALSLLESRMKEASQVQKYERAAQIRDELEFMKTIHSRPHFLCTALLERTGAVLYTLKGKIEIHFMAYGFPIAHAVWPCDPDTFNAVKSIFHERVLYPPDRLTMQQVDAITVLGAWMFKERESISVLPLTSNGSRSEFDAALEEMLDQIHSRQQK